MSAKMNQRHSRLEILCHHGMGLWIPDNSLVEQSHLDSVLALWVARLHDLLLPSLSDPQLDRVLRRWLTYHKKVSFRDVLHLSDACADQLLAGHESYDSFKRSLGDFQDVGVFLAPLRRVIERWITEKDPHSFNIAYSALSFPLRGNFPSPYLEEKALQSYLNDETMMWDGEVHPNLNKLVRSWLSKFDPSEIRVSHGGGSTADAGRVLEDKYLSLRFDDLLMYVVQRVNGTDLLGGPGLRRMSKTVFVPKSYKAFRTISMEPAPLMWWQQHVLRCLNRTIKRSALGRHYNPEDQAHNRELAWIGSIDGSYATIDLSSASDLVSWSLVKQVFKGTPVLQWLFATRSISTILPDGSVIPLKKFAPMGSALSFPVEVIVFSAIVETALHECGLDPDYLVYGDDIIIPTQAASAVISLLEQHGFRVNKRKTWSTVGDGPLYRESCGGEYLGGVDVTPLRIPRNFRGFSTKRDSNTFTGLVDFANECFIPSPSCRWLLINELLSLPKSLRPIFSSDEVGLFSSQPTNWHLNKRWNSSLQIWEVQHGSPRTVAEPGCEGIRLLEYLRTTQDRLALGDYPLAVTVGHSTQRLIQSAWSFSPIQEG